MKFSKITDPDHLFNNIAKKLFESYTKVGIQLGLTYNVLTCTDELETGEFKLWQGSRKAQKMLQLWQRSVTEDDCTYSVLASALEEHGHRNCAYEYCYTTGNYMINNLLLHVLMDNYILGYNLIKVNEVGIIT